MDYRAVLLSLALLTLLDSVEPKRSFKVELNNLTCVVVEPSFVNELSCILHRKRIVPSLSVRFNLKETIKDFSISFKVDLIKRDHSKITLAHHKLDGCKFLSSLYGNIVYTKFFKRIQSVSNLPSKCPVQANKLYEIHNHTLLADEYPPAAPEMPHQLQLKFLKADKLVADILAQGAIVY